jgi:hypothetical protein
VKNVPDTSTRTITRATRPLTESEGRGMEAPPQTISPQFSLPQAAEATQGRSRARNSVTAGNAQDPLEARRAIASNPRVDIIDVV